MPNNPITIPADAESGTLWLVVKSEPWKTHCSLCGSKGSILPGCCGVYKRRDGSSVYYDGGFTCPACDGTGKRTIRLEGVVKVDCSDDIYGELLFCILPGQDLNWYLLHKGEFVRRIIAAWRDGTLPPEVAAGLKEMDDEKVE